jgi:N-acetylneuraminic acid mutarotase
MAVAEVGGKIYAIGGHVGDFGRRAFVTTVQSYDPATDKWTQRAPLAEGASHFHNAAVVLNGAILVAGGKTDDEAAMSDVMLYDPLINKWRKVGDLPEGRNSGLLAAVNGVLVYTTGSSGGGDFEANTYRGEFDLDD